MIAAYIQELLKSQNRVIIPDLGAFIVSRSPSGDIVSFNDFLKFNDGVLINHIIKVEKISKTEALEKLKEFKKHAEKGFRENNCFDLPGFGFLYRDDKGNILFKTGEPNQEKTDTGSEPQPEIKTKPEPFASVAVDHEKNHQNNTEQAATNIKATVEKTEHQKTSYSSPKSTAMDSTKKIIIIASISLVLLAGVVFSLIYFDIVKMESITFWKSTKPEIELPAPVAVPDTTPVPVAEPEPEPVQPASPVANIVKYHVVAGSFKNQNYAEKFSEKLKQEGYNSTIVGPRDGFYVVTYGSFEKKQEAIAEYNRLKESISQVWILKY